VKIFDHIKTFTPSTQAHLLNLSLLLVYTYTYVKLLGV